MTDREVAALALAVAKAIVNDPPLLRRLAEEVAKLGPPSPPR